MKKIFNVIYFTISLICLIILVQFWEDINAAIKIINFETYEILFISFFIINYLFLGIVDYIKDHNVYYGLTKNSVQVMINFTIVILTLLTVDFILTGELKIKLSILNPVELLGIGIFYIITSIVTNEIIIKKYNGGVTI